MKNLWFNPMEVEGKSRKALFERAPLAKPPGIDFCDDRDDFPISVHMMLCRASVDQWARKIANDEKASADVRLICLEIVRRLDHWAACQAAHRLVDILERTWALDGYLGKM